VAVLARCPAPCLAELLLSGPLTASQSVELLGGVAAATEALFDAGLVARNLTPEHIHLDPHLGGVLSDRATPLELIAGRALDVDEHLAYRSPEQLEGKPVDLRSNVYSLGALLFTALVGAPPFGGAWSNVYVGHLSATRPRASAVKRDLSPAIDAVIARALAVEPAERYADPTELTCAAAEALHVPLPLAIPGAARRAAGAPETEPDARPGADDSGARKEAPTPVGKRGQRRVAKPAPNLSGAFGPVARGTVAPAAAATATPSSGPASRNPQADDAVLTTIVPPRGAAGPTSAPGTLLVALKSAPKSGATNWARATRDPGESNANGSSGKKGGTGPRGRNARSGRKAASVGKVPRAAKNRRDGSRAVKPPAPKDALTENRPSAANGASTKNGGSARNGAAEKGRASGNNGASTKNGASVTNRASGKSGARGKNGARRKNGGAGKNAVPRKNDAVSARNQPSPNDLAAATNAAGENGAPVASRASGASGASAKNAADAKTKAPETTNDRAAPKMAGAAQNTTPATNDGRAKHAGATAAKGDRGIHRSENRSRRKRALVVLGAAGLAGACTVVMAPLGSEDLDSRIAARGLSVKLSSGWEQIDSGNARFLRGGRIAASPSVAGEAGLVAALYSDGVAAMAEIKDASTGTPRRTPVRLGRFDAWRYPQLSPAPGVVGTAYFAHTTGGPLLVLCHAAGPKARIRLAECGEVAATLRVDGERPVSRAAVAERSRSFRSNWRTLQAEYVELRARLAEAPIADEQAAAARELEEAFRRGSGQVAAIDSPTGMSGFRALSSQLSVTADGYRDLAGAILDGDADGYSAAREAILAREAGLRIDVAAVLAG